MSDAEDTLKRISAHKGVNGLIIINPEGIPIYTTMDNSTTVQYSGLLCTMTQKARHVIRDLEPENDLTFLRIRSKKNEIMCAPCSDYTLAVIQSTDGTQ